MTIQGQPSEQPRITRWKELAKLLEQGWRMVDNFDLVSATGERRSAWGNAVKACRDRGLIPHEAAMIPTDHIAQPGRLVAPCDAAAEAFEQVQLPLWSNPNRPALFPRQQPVRKPRVCECKCGCSAELPREQFWWRICNPCGHRASIDGVRQLPGQGDWDTRCKRQTSSDTSMPCVQV